MRNLTQLTVCLFLASRIAAEGHACLGAEVSFDREIQPLFAEHCLHCHGNDADERQADLQLDLEASAKAGAIVPGYPEQGSLMERISSDDPDLKMPPGEKSSLSQQEIELVRRWIREGAKYERHWALEPIRDPPPPPSPSSNDSLTDVDRFILKRLTARGLNLAEAATKEHLIRRATFDLTGLPPTWDEVESFRKDDSPEAFEKVVDRLLASPAYGQRWGRHWLDIARYADTHGGAAIGFKKFAFSYTYRDYVIKAFNQDLPYDRFVKEQLAADQMGLADDAEQLAALGFLTVGMQFRNGHDTIDDQIDVVTRGLMGLTVTCARCHDHKFDAIPTADYYSLYAVFASSRKPDELPILGAPTASPQRREYERKLQRLKTSHGDLAREQVDVLRARLRMQVGMYLREIAQGAPERELLNNNVFSYRTDDLRPTVIELWRRYLAKMPDSDPVFGPWVQLSRFSAEAKEDGRDLQHHCQQLVQKLTEENGDPVKDLQRLSTSPPRWNPRVLETLAAAKPTSMLDVADAYGELFVEVQREWLQSKLQAAVEAIPNNKPVPDESPKHLVINSSVHRQLRRHLYGAESPICMPDNIAATLLNRPVKDNLSGRKGAIHNLNLNATGSPPRAMTLVEEMNPEPFYVFRRGNPLDRGPAVPARFLTAVGGGEGKEFKPGQRRLALANAIVDPANPLTRRVIVNWVWRHHFGKGLVRTPDDLGTRGDRPTHPDLLDYLATKFHQEDGWSLKALHRRMMLTKVYQQASRQRLDARQADPDNRLLWRMPRRRLDLEAMRDAMLAASGELKRTDAGGRPFELLSPTTVPRRSVYAFINRDIVAPLLSTFDGANPNACTAKRPETTVPQQTLFALNSDFIQDRGTSLAKWVCDRTDDAEARIGELYRRALSRQPAPDELAQAVAYIDNAARDDQVDSIKPWQQLAHALLASNEFVFVD
ncbi:MAG: PSD1 and planctomycete cytochrome C domain-containing protein [Pirellulales bacterium]|nr:PSD1 and planctomycete cytochrome C domain-containing protein [Pirellulales bacterium]